ncbi:MAG: peptide chain release factor-like protein [bacterium]|nr:peptide chain release factor-like protein [bacterium]
MSKANERTPEHYRHPAAWPDELLLRECTVGQSRSSGPGGQHRNKVSTQVTITHQPTGISATAGERRSASDNKREALRRLRLKLASEHRVGVPEGEIGSPLWRSRVQKPKRVKQPKQQDKDPFFEEMGITLRNPEPEVPLGRIVVSPKHRDFPAILAEAMDAIASAGWEVKPAAIRLGVSPTQVIKLVKDHTAAWAQLTEHREARGLHRLS